MSKTIELLAPAKNLECGIAAIDHGADAVYIGASQFGARAAAANSVNDIKTLCEYAHTFMAKVYVTVNTIIYDNELSATKDLISQLYEAGADAILVQDMALVSMIASDDSLPPIPIHASTQTDNRTADKVKWLASLGFSRVVLARELSTTEIAQIHKAAPDVELEVFVHGALCVSYSGQCYASQYCFGRSANRGECAQFCRLKFDLEDNHGNIIEHGRHLLSLKDLCLIDRLKTLLDSGATSLKIEGRLKDITYVKNVTAAYSRRLNDIIAHSDGRYRRASLGCSTYTFDPNLNKTFSRGFTHYFADGRSADMISPLTPKAIGQYVGTVKSISRNELTVDGTATFSNGDGLCFFNSRNELQGFRVNRAQGNTIFPQKMPAGLSRGQSLYRNSDQAFEKLLTGKSAERKINITMSLSESAPGYIILTATADNVSISTVRQCTPQAALKPQTDNIVRQLTRLGNTPFECTSVSVPQDGIKTFIPSSFLAHMRRSIVQKLEQALRQATADARTKAISRATRAETDGSNTYPTAHPYLYNVANDKAAKFYKSHHMQTAPTPEISMPNNTLLMQCRYCLRHALNICMRHHKVQPYGLQGPLYLRMADGRRFRLQFDCVRCQMNVIADNNSLIKK